MSKREYPLAGLHPNTRRDRPSRTDSTSDDGEGDIPYEIAKLMLQGHAAQHPVKRSDILETLHSRNHTPARLPIAVKSASSYLESTLGLKIIELGTVNITTQRASPQRHEYVLISASAAGQQVFVDLLPSQVLKDHGLLVFVLSLIVIKGDPMTEGDICESVFRAGLFPAEDNEDIDEGPKRRADEINDTLKRLAGMRFLETEVFSDGPSADKTIKYHIGPYTREVFSAKDIRNFILTFNFPTEDTRSSDFQEKYRMAIKALNNKFDHTSFLSIPDEDQ